MTPLSVTPTSTAFELLCAARCCIAEAKRTGKRKWLIAARYWLLAAQIKRETEVVL